jgi:hypothetical protein
MLESTDRIIGRLGGHSPGPTIIVVGGLHGNEPAGVYAAGRFLEDASAYEEYFRGHLVALIGNPPALERDIRYVDLDMNRIWAADLIEAIVASPEEAGEPAEFQQLRELREQIDEALDAATGPVHLLDLHTTSSPSPPFIWHVAGTAQSQAVVDYGLPIVFDPMQRIAGTLAGCVATGGHQALVAESGPHDFPEAVAYHESILWLTAVDTGALPEDVIKSEVDSARQLLAGARADTPLLNAIVQHHKIVDGDGFAMRPGYSSFDPVVAGEVLAEDRDGEVAAASSGRILMPLYKPPCEDGFMIIDELEAWPS